MNPTQFIWIDGNYLAWQDAHVHIQTYTLHYGAGVFEGIRLYNTINGPALLCLNEHIDRLFDSFSVFEKPIPFNKKQIKEAIINLIKKNNLKAAYIRPIIYLGCGVMSLDITHAPVHVAISMWPWEKHFGTNAISIKTSPFIRPHPQSTFVDKKINGHYVNSILAHMDAKKSGYDEALLLDYNNNLAEGAAANIFLIKNNILKTPQLGSILPGITRAKILEIARYLSITTKECTLKLEDIYQSDEAFFTGTAVEIIPIKCIDNQTIGTGSIGPITQKINTIFSSIISGNSKQFDHWLTYIQ